VVVKSRKGLRRRYGHIKKYPIIYRGWAIEPDESTQIGHKLPNSRNTFQQLGLRTHRKTKGYLLTYAPDNSTKIVDTLKAAYEYIDNYMGDA
jgi:hypothetical protein